MNIATAIILGAGRKPQNKQALEIWYRGRIEGWLLIHRPDMAQKELEAWQASGQGD